MSEPRIDRKLVRDHIAQRLREARAGCDWTQTELGKQLGLTQAGISLWEGGHRAPGVADLIELAATLGKPLGYFIPEFSDESRAGSR